jgi:hypothetical protein
MASVNHPPAPVLERLDVVIHGDADCEALKVTYGVATGKHGANPKGGAVQSHHILQNAAMKNAAGKRIISTYSGHAAMLNGGSCSPGSEHDIANKHQAARARKDAKAANPRPTFGQLKQWAKGDLAAAFQHGNPSRGMTNKEAEMLADCITNEAIEALQNHRTRRGKPRLNDNSRVTNPRGCFALGTLVWTVTGPRPVESLARGDALQGPNGIQHVTRTDVCFNNVVEIELDGAGETLSLSSTHRVLLARGRYVAAAMLRAGHELATKAGVPAVVTCVRPREDGARIIGVGVSVQSVAFIGRRGVTVEFPDTGPAVRDHVDLSTLAPYPAEPNWRT